MPEEFDASDAQRPPADALDPQGPSAAQGPPAEDSAEDEVAAAKRREANRKKREKQKSKLRAEKAKDEIPRVERRQTEDGRGLGLFSVDSVQSGQVILAAQPAISVLFDRVATEVCGCCFDDSTSVVEKEVNVNRGSDGRWGLFIDTDKSGSAVFRAYANLDAKLLAAEDRLFAGDVLRSINGTSVEGGLDGAIRLLQACTADQASLKIARASIASSPVNTLMAVHPPDDRASCIICLDSSPSPIQSGCACRGDGGLAHVDCLVNAAASQQAQRGGDAWSRCQTCKQEFTGAMQMGLAEAWSRVAFQEAERKERLAAEGHLARCLSQRGRYLEAEQIQRKVLKSLTLVHGAEHPATLGGAGTLRGCVGAKSCVVEHLLIIFAFAAFHHFDNFRVLLFFCSF